MRVMELPRSLIHTYWRLKNRMDIRWGRRAKHIVICGYPRSGTSLLFNMISASIAGFRCENFEELALHRLHRSGNYVTKFPLDILNVDEIINSNPLEKDIYFVAMIRDVRDLVSSRHPMVPDRYFIGYQSSLWPKNKQFTEWQYEAPGIHAVYNAIQNCASRTDISFLKLHYEDLVSNPDQAQRRVENFASIKFVAPFSDYHKRQHKHAYRYADRHRAVDTSLVRENDQVDISRISKWNNPEHAGVIREQFSRHPELLQILIDDGYELDTQWFVDIRDADK